MCQTFNLVAREQSLVAGSLKSHSGRLYSKCIAFMCCFDVPLLRKMPLQDVPFKRAGNLGRGAMRRANGRVRVIVLLTCSVTSNTRQIQVTASPIIFLSNSRRPG